VNFAEPIIADHQKTILYSALIYLEILQSIETILSILIIVKVQRKQAHNLW